MFQLLNLLLAIFLYCLAWIMFRYSRADDRTGLVKRASMVMHSNLLRSSTIILTLWIYVIASIAIWVGWAETFVQIMLAGLGLIGGVSTIVELRILQKRSPLIDGPAFYISTIEYYVDTMSENETRDAIIGMILEAETNDDAKQALDSLLARDDKLGEETKKLYDESSKNKNDHPE